MRIMAIENEFFNVNVYVWRVILLTYIFVFIDDMQLLKII